MTKRAVVLNPRTGNFRVTGKGEVDRQGLLHLIASASDALAAAGRRRDPWTDPDPQPGDFDDAINAGEVAVTRRRGNRRARLRCV